MKQQLLICFFLLDVALCFPRPQEAAPPLSQVEKNAMTLIEDLFKEKCDNNVEVEDVFKTTLSCLREFIPKNVDELRGTVKLDAMREICSTASNYVKVTKCFNGFEELLKECKVPIESYLKSFLLKFVEKIIEKICSGGGPANFEVLFAPATISCFESSSSQMNLACGPSLNVFQSNALIDESIFYNDLNKIGTCYTNYITANCAAATGLKLLVQESTNTAKSSYVYRTTPKPRVVVQPTSRPSYTPSYAPVYNYNNPLNNVMDNVLPIAAIGGAFAAIGAAAPVIAGAAPLLVFAG